MIEDKEKLCLIFEYYNKLLTENQAYVFEQYYFLDISLNEIAEQINVSKQAVKDTLDKAITNLLKYENILRLAEKYSKFEEIKKLKSLMPIEEYLEALEKILEE